MKMKMSMNESMRAQRIGIIGARGHTGQELIGMIARHPGLELAFVSSRKPAGERVADHHDSYRGDVVFEALTPQDMAARAADIVVLALPNGKSSAFVQAAESMAGGPLLVDISADHRFDGDWHYGLPEFNRRRWSGGRRISNPGCYSTAMILAVAPVKDRLAAPAVCFGVSGYSGAGTMPSDRNNPEKLADNLMPYALTGHGHEREAAFHLGTEVEFMPHVAPHFRGLSVTCSLRLEKPASMDEVLERYRHFYAGEPLVRLLPDDAPWVSRVAGTHYADIGGFSLSEDGRRLVLVATLDNLLKGAATQAMQNINIAIGAHELAGIVNAAGQTADQADESGDKSHE